MRGCDPGVVEADPLMGVGEGGLGHLPKILVYTSNGAFQSIFRP